MPRLVVLTPIKNEAWILERFLAVTSAVADLIVIADQGSTDNSRAICGRFPKVHLVDNPASDYDEASRQHLLLRTSRELVPGPRVLLALDADEIIAADAPLLAGWRAMLAAAPGTVLCFEKPDLWQGTDLCVRYSTPWPLGYVDDGAEHRAGPVHSIRIPLPEGGPRFEVPGVRILHYALARPDHQASKCRFYSVQENLRGSSPLVRRRALYSPDRDWTAAGRLEPAPREWFAGWQEKGIDLHALPREKYYWQDFEVLRVLGRHGARRFWLDPIWSFDWEGCRRAALTLDLPGIPTRPVTGPPARARIAGFLLDRLYGAWRRLRN